LNYSETKSQRLNKTADKFVMPRKRESGYTTPDRTPVRNPQTAPDAKKGMYQDIHKTGYVATKNDDILGSKPSLNRSQQYPNRNLKYWNKNDDIIGTQTQLTNGYKFGQKQTNYALRNDDIAGTKGALPCEKFETRVPSSMDTTHLVGTRANDGRKFVHTKETTDKFLDSWSKPRKPYKPKFIRDNIDCKDIAGATPTKFRKELKKTEEQKKQVDTGSKSPITRREVRDPNHKGIYSK
jgi:hypothetical protein